MIRFQRSMQLKRGKHGMHWAKELVEYINAKYPNTSLQLFKSRFGDVFAVYWIADFEDLVALDEWQEQIGADEGYRELIKKSLDIVVDGTVRDTLMISV